MIKDRNIAPDASIDPLKIAGLGIGEVRYVVKSDSNAHKLLRTKVGNLDLLYVCDGTADEVQINQAITDSKGGTNSYIYVFPGAYTLAAAITCVGRSSLHLVAANGTGFDIGAPGAALLQQGGNAEVVTLEAYGELTGFQIINKAGYAAVKSAAWRPNVHNNYFHVVQGTACNIVEATTQGFTHGNISFNRFQTWVGGAMTSYISITGSNSCLVERNTIMNYSGTVDYGILCGSGVQNLVLDNLITDCGGAGTITVAIDVGNPTGNVAIGNRLAVLSGRGFAGGTANRSFVQNFDATSGGATPIET